MTENPFSILNQVDVSSFTEKKNGLTYLSWADAWTQVCLAYPGTNYHVYESDDKTPIHRCGNTAYVKVGVTVEDKEIIEYLAVMDFQNRSKAIDQITTMDMIKTIQRCATKAIARHGLGMHVYRGEDLTEEPEKPAPQVKREAKDDPFFNKGNGNGKKAEQPKAEFTTADKTMEPPEGQMLLQRRVAISDAIEADDTNTLEAIAKDILVAHECKAFAVCPAEVLTIIEQAFAAATKKPMPADREAVVNEIVTLKATKLTVKKAVDEFMKKVQKMFLRDLTDGELYEVWKLVEELKKVKA